MDPYAASDNTVAEKAFLRRRFVAWREALSSAAYTERSQAICDRLALQEGLHLAKTVLAYWPLTDRHEVDVRPLVRLLMASNKQIVLPVVVSFSRKAKAGPRLRLVQLRDEADLVQNRWGIWEPAGGPALPPEAIDAALVPALGAGRDGYRIGFGYGYYDELLASTTGQTYCPIYADCLLPTVPHDDHDQQVDLVVTESETHYVGSA